MILRILEQAYWSIFNEMKGNLETKSFKQTKIKGRKISFFSDLKISAAESNLSFKIFFNLSSFFIYKLTIDTIRAINRIKME